VAQSKKVAVDRGKDCFYRGGVGGKLSCSVKQDQRVKGEGGTCEEKTNQASI